ncbi:hypothetical protein PANA5342_0914 [Pantoea ananatis LMG 5342]|nr:hypothetical protein PANA5342_0914 [Pantoea ananatis LMG 5342]
MLFIHSDRLKLASNGLIFVEKQQSQGCKWNQ